ncbi:class I SAM-dependent methyltransferase [Agrobacterium rubi]|uniref:class I SAM-dependent methyltransferase n=1 Tax=Agrobacterium rubi TaxID=28099 RepID=UPI0015740333|nr:class I SAM-dependent methyltransferase [Agrobacterium rubi]NTF11098.1 class I SAM-dependent methyltransferase [Agrobacterium rubi]NTF23472.1 class I SAM-dependent methyltransferase [Agrobacterium rubi]NTF30415.1 class I SAM-dependent methyltransferase [Agrobacterium rubi]
MSLYSLFLENDGRPIHKMAHYFFAYERHFSKFVNQPLTFLEIGAGNGGSSQMWKKWFGPLARIVTIDINPICKQFEDEQVAVRIGDQSDPIFLATLIEEFGRFDAVLDDGSHQMEHVTKSFNFLYPRIAQNAVYMVEDMHTAYWPEWGGGLRSNGSFIERFKMLIDELNAKNIREGALPATEFTNSTFCMTAYDSVVVFEKSAYLNANTFNIGDQELRANY